ncbi:MAG: Card1-like endonuclease domain-containing protein [Ectothiorhodospira sp.]
MTRLHIQLVSNQLAGNLIPALMERPEHAALVVTPDMAAKARQLRELEEEAGIVVRTFENAPDADLPRLHEFALEVLDGLPVVDEVVLNLTGGNKLMALGFLEMLRDTVHRRIYTDTAHGRLEHLPVGSERADPPTPLGHVLDVPISLRAQGFRYRSAVSAGEDWRRVAGERKQVAKKLAEVARDHGDFLGALNGVASRALDREGRLVAHEQAFDQTPRGRWANHLGWLRDQGLLDWEGGAGVIFLDEAHTRFLNGGWLEEYVYHRLRDEGVDDVALGVEGTWDGTDGARNELDVVAVHANRLLVVECKTARHGRDDAVDDQQLYKLDSIGDKLRGFFGSSWMVSARRPSQSMRERARQHDIQLIGPEELPRLRDIVRAWKASMEGAGRA